MKIKISDLSQKGLGVTSDRQKKLMYMANEINKLYPNFTNERPRKAIKREALLMIERKTGKKQGTI